MCVMKAEPRRMHMEKNVKEFPLYQFFWTISNFISETWRKRSLNMGFTLGSEEEEQRQNERSSSLSRSVNLAARKFDQTTRRFKLVPEASTQAGSGGPEGGKNLNKYFLPLTFPPNSSSLIFTKIRRPRSFLVQFLVTTEPSALP